MAKRKYGPNSGNPMKDDPPGTPVNPSIERDVARGFRQGRFGSVSTNGVDCSGPRQVMSNLDMAQVNPNGYTTYANGGWEWYARPGGFERWIPKPEQNEVLGHWVLRMCRTIRVANGDAESTGKWEWEEWVDHVNQALKHLDWA